MPTMFHSGKCPECKTTVGNLAVEEVTASAGIGSTQWRGLTLLCLSCRTVLGASLDPVALQTDLANSIARKLRPGASR
jgi:hypothetical protein